MSAESAMDERVEDTTIAQPASPETSSGSPRSSVETNPTEVDDSELKPAAGPCVPEQIVPSKVQEVWEESSDDEDDDLEPPSSDGIRRRKRKPDQKRIRPAYYYPTHEAAAAYTKGVPVFEPTMEEFEDFYDFVNAVDHYGMKSGIVKVVPPKEWKESLPSISERLRQTRIREPVSELFTGSQGLFRQTNMMKTRNWNAKQWKDQCDSDRYATPDFFKKGNPDGSPVTSTRPKRTPASRRKKAATPAPIEEDVKMEEEAPQDQSVPVEEVIRPRERSADPSVPVTPLKNEASESVPPCENAESVREESVAPGSASAPKAKKPTAKKLAEMTDEEWNAFDWATLAHGAKPEDFTLEACKEIERRYWRTLTFGEPPMYGADMKGSLFDPSVKNWNVANLDDLLQRMRPKQKIPGVNTPYLYFGMWRATFAWHVEDADLYSINYVHFGAPKYWYSVPQEEADRFERVMAGWFPADRKKCPEFLRHKSFLASPSLLKDQGIHLNRCIQLPGEIMLTYPRGYHSGFNVGFNCAESINFATETWVDIGRKAKSCTCVQDSVSINVDAWLEEARQEAELEKAIAYAKANNLPLPPGAIEEAAPKRVYKKRAMVEGPDGMPVRKKAKKGEEEMDDLEVPVDPAVAEKRAATAAKKAAKEEARRMAAEREAKFVCVLCPDSTPDTLVKLVDAPPGSAAEKDPRRKAGAAHKICVMFTPSTYIVKNEVTGEERVHGFEGVEKARWGLKCQLCTEAHGAKVQCTKNAKCVRAHHVTCALKENSGVIIDAVMGEGEHEISLMEGAKEAGRHSLDIFDLPAVSASPTANTSFAAQQQAAPQAGPSTIDHPMHLAPAPVAQPVPATVPEMHPEDAVGSIRLVVCCRQHNPAWAELQKKLKVKALAEKVAQLPIGYNLKVKASGGVYMVKLQGVLPAKDSVSVQFEDGKQSNLKYTSIVWKEDVPVMSVQKKSKPQDDYIYEGVRPVQRSRSSAGQVPTLPSMQQSTSASPLHQNMYAAPSAQYAPQYMQQHLPPVSQAMQYVAHPGFQQHPVGHAYPLPNISQAQYQQPQAMMDYYANQNVGRLPSAAPMPMLPRTTLPPVSSIVNSAPHLQAPPAPSNPYQYQY